jgi:hypothetical protein
MSAIAMLEQRFAQAGHSGRIIAPCTHNPPLQLEEFGCGQHHSQRKHGDHRFSDSAHREGSQSLQLQLFEIGSQTYAREGQQEGPARQVGQAADLRP